ncbi:MAG: phosphoglycerate mutase family protein [Patescibacteria group bacterium]
MRLIENDTNGCSSGQVLVLIRHGVDVSVLSKDLNQPLTEGTKPDIRTLAKQVIKFCGKTRTKTTRIWHSNRLRAIQTASIIAEEFFSADIPTEMSETVGVREIYQGDFVIKNHTHGNDYKPLVDAWQAWQAKLDASELLYRFGNPNIGESGKAEYPELEGWFEKFGEHQADFSLRVYSFLKEMLECGGDDLHIVIGHQASCSRIQRIMSAAITIANAHDFQSGEFVKFLEKKGTRITIEPASGVVIKKPERSLITSILKKEINYLESIV